MDAGTEIRFALERTRDETDGLLKPLSDEALSAPVPEPGLPLVWVLADIGRFEELWLLRASTVSRPWPTGTTTCTRRSGRSGRGAGAP